MANPNRTNRFLIKVGDGGDPETFGFPCGANARSVSLTNNLGEDVVLDCDDPLELASTIVRYLESQDTTLSIEGKISKGDSLTMWREWADSGTERNCQISIDEPAASGGGYWTVPCFLGGLELGAEGKSTMNVSASIMGNGRRIWTDSPV